MGRRRVAHRRERAALLQRPKEGDGESGPGRDDDAGGRESDANHPLDQSRPKGSDVRPYVGAESVKACPDAGAVCVEVRSEVGAVGVEIRPSPAAVAVEILPGGGIGMLDRLPHEVRDGVGLPALDARVPQLAGHRKRVEHAGTQSIRTWTCGEAVELAISAGGEHPEGVERGRVSSQDAVIEGSPVTPLHGTEERQGERPAIDDCRERRSQAMLRPASGARPGRRGTPK